MKLSVVIPIYNEEENLAELYRRLRLVCEGLDAVNWQVIYVNDGSQDRSLEIMRQQSREDPRFCVVDLSRNFGHQAAISPVFFHSS